RLPTRWARWSCSTCSGAGPRTTRRGRRYWSAILQGCSVSNQVIDKTVLEALLAFHFAFRGRNKSPCDLGRYGVAYFRCSDIGADYKEEVRQAFLVVLLEPLLDLVSR